MTLVLSCAVAHDASDALVPFHESQTATCSTHNYCTHHNEESTTTINGENSNNSTQYKPVSDSKTMLTIILVSIYSTIPSCGWKENPDEEIVSKHILKLV